MNIEIEKKMKELENKIDLLYVQVCALKNCIEIIAEDLYKEDKAEK